MDISRIVSVACVLLLSLCCLLSIYAVAVLQRALIESTEACFEVKAILETMEPEPVASTEDNDLSESDSDSSLPVDVLADHFCIRETNGKIAIYTADGYRTTRSTTERQLLLHAHPESVAVGEALGELLSAEAVWLATREGYRPVDVVTRELTLHHSGVADKLSFAIRSTHKEQPLWS